MLTLKTLIKTFYLKFIPQLLFIYFIVIDSINGYLQEYMDVHLPIGLIPRLLLLVLLFDNLIKSHTNTINKLFRVILLIYILSIPLWIINRTGIEIYGEVQYIFRFVYFYAVFFYFYLNRAEWSISQICNWIIASALIIAIMNIFCFALGIGNRSYGEDYGFGVKAFYADGNSLGLYMIISNVVAVWYALYSKGRFIIYAIVISIGTLLIGSRAAIFGTIVSWGILLLYVTFVHDKVIKTSLILKLLIFIVGGCIVLYGLTYMYNYITNYDSYTVDKFSVESVLSSREKLINCGKDVIKDFDCLEFMVGKSVSGGKLAVGEVYYFYQGEPKSIESDFYDMILYFGWFLGGLMIFLQFLIFRSFLSPFFKYKSSLSLSLFTIGVLWFVASYMAGHGFNNTMVAPLLGSIYAISKKISDYNGFQNGINMG